MRTSAVPMQQGVRWPHFLFHNFIEKKNRRNLRLLFWQMKLYSTEADITGARAHIQMMFRVKDKKCRVFEFIFPGK